MSIKELRAAAENKDGWVNYLHAQDFADYLSELEVAGDGGEIVVDARDLEELVRRARHSNALPALLAVVEAAEAETKHPEHHGHWYGYMPNSTTPNPCPCALCAALRHLNEKGNADADTG